MPLDIEMADSILNGPQLRADAEEAVIAAAEARAASTSGEATTAESAELDAAVEDMFETYGGDGEAARAEIESARQEERALAAVELEMEALRTQLQSGNFGGGRFYFKGRVEMVGLDGSKTMSNYHNIIPDPCNLPITANPKQIIRILSAYPTFVSQSGYEGKMPMVGEVVKVTMHRGDFAQNGQWNEFDTLSKVELDTGATTLPSEGECSSLKNLFEYGEGDNNVDSTLGQPADAPDIEVSMSGVDLHHNSQPSPDTTIDEFPFPVVNMLDAPLGRIIRSRARDWIGIVIHYSAGWTGESAIRTLGGRGLSYHFIIERNGEIWQCVKLKDAAQHCRGYNGNHIGISLVNVGYERPGVNAQGSHATIDPWYEDDGTNFHNGNRGHTWQPYPQEQQNALVRLTKDLIGRWPGIQREHVITHAIAEPGRKLDIGPAIDLEATRDRIYG